MPLNLPALTGMLPRVLRRKLPEWRVRVRDAWRGETAATMFNIHSRAELNDLLRRLDLPPARPRRLAKSAPTPLAWKARLAYQQRPDIRESIPLGLTPRDRGLLLAWLVKHATEEVGFSPEDAVSALFAADADPSRGLAETYLHQPRWQRAVPNALTPARWAELKRWLAAEYGLGSRWFRNAAIPKRDTTPADVLVLGMFRYASGLQQAALGMVDALDRAGIIVGRRDVPGPALREDVPGPLDALETAPITIVHTGLDMPISDAYWRAGLAPVAGVYRIGCWWWELEQLPAEWHVRGLDADEVWAPTRFIADALSVLGRPVFPMLPGVELGRPAGLGKAAFGMRDDRFTFVVMFDANSRLQRKNPVAVVRAFRKAFRPREAVELVVKMTPPGPTPSAGVSELRAECAAAGVTLVERQLTRPETLAFLAASDSLVSLHRSEGFGLPLAEAMLMGKPVIATGYSGNLDFMTTANSYLVDYTRTTIKTDDPPYYQGFVWAEPSVDHAAMLMRRVFDHQADARAVGERASGELMDRLSLDAAGRRMRDRLDEIRANLADDTRAME